MSITGTGLRGTVRLVVVATALGLLTVLGLAPVGTAEDRAAPPPAPAPAAPSAARYAGAETCLACHAEVGETQAKDWHSSRLAHQPGSKNCEECHGPSAAHAEDPNTVHTATDVTRASAERSAAACLRCHEAEHRSLDWRLSEHARAGVTCWSCHSQGGTVHGLTIRRPDRKVCYSCHREQQARFELTSHHPVREGRLTCADCHNPHRRATGASTNRLCVTCHTEQRGPFVFAHGAISGNLTDGCLDCHQPHGSPNGRLLKYSGRGLCLQCHADHALHFVGRTCWTSGCHAQQHGSNTNPLFLGH